MAKRYKTLTEYKRMDRYDIEGTLKKVIENLEEMREEYGEDSYLELSAEDDYGCEIGVSLRIERKETDKERDKRLAKAKKEREQAAKNREEREDKEKARLVDLINKYGVPGEKSSTEDI